MLLIAVMSADPRGTVYASNDLIEDRLPLQVLIPVGCSLDEVLNEGTVIVMKVPVLIDGDDLVLILALDMNVSHHSESRAL